MCVIKSEAGIWGSGIQVLEGTKPIGNRIRKRDGIRVSPIGRENVGTTIDEILAGEGISPQMSLVTFWEQ